MLLHPFNTPEQIIMLLLISCLVKDLNWSTARWFFYLPPLKINQVFSNIVLDECVMCLRYHHHLVNQTEMDQKTWFHSINLTVIALLCIPLIALNNENITSLIQRLCIYQQLKGFTPHSEITELFLDVLLGSLISQKTTNTSFMN